MKWRMIYLAALVGLVGVAMAARTMTVRAVCKSPENEVIESGENIEIRKNPVLMSAVTTKKGAES